MIALDCEMSGLNPLEHAILSIGALDLENPKRSFYGECFLPPNKTFQVEALAVNGFTEEQIFDKSKDSLKTLMEKFYEWLQGCAEKTLVGQNVSHDRAFLNTAFAESEVPFQFHYRIVDIHSVAVAMFLRDGRSLNIEDGRIKMSLDKIAEAVGLPEEPRPHNALTGATYNAEVFTRLVYKKNLIEQFKDYEVRDLNFFDLWNNVKKHLDINTINKYPKHKDVWMCHLGKNIGFEQNGSGSEFQRPVLVVKKITNRLFVVVPLSTKQKDFKHYLNFTDPNDRKVSALLQQYRIVDVNRFDRKMYILDENSFLQIKDRIKTML